MSEGKLPGSVEDAKRGSREGAFWARLEGAVVVLSGEADTELGGDEC